MYLHTVTTYRQIFSPGHDRSKESQINDTWALRVLYSVRMHIYIPYVYIHTIEALMDRASYCNLITMVYSCKWWSRIEQQHGCAAVTCGTLNKNTFLARYIKYAHRLVNTELTWPSKLTNLLLNNLTDHWGQLLLFIYSLLPQQEFIWLMITSPIKHIF